MKQITEKAHKAALEALEALEQAGTVRNDPNLVMRVAEALAALKRGCVDGDGKRKKLAPEGLAKAMTAGNAVWIVMPVAMWTGMPVGQLVDLAKRGLVEIADFQEALAVNEVVQPQAPRE